MRFFSVIFVFFSIVLSLRSQTVDKIIAQLGDEIILSSELETQYLQFISEGYIDETIKCQILDDLLYQKLLIHTAKIDSINVSDDDVNEELDRRLGGFISQLGSEAALEDYFGKTIVEIKDDFFDVIYDQLLSSRMQSNITSSVSVTPAEVNLFFESIKQEGDLPLVPLKFELSQIVKVPEIGSEEKSRVRKKLISFRDRVNKGEDFKVLATLYSEDVESAKNGGELGFVSRDQLVAEFASVAFSLKENEISEIVETNYGYHIIQCIERKSDMVNVRHILMKPKVLSSSIRSSRDELNNIITLIKNGDISFEDASKTLSDDLSKNNGGLIVNQYTGSSIFTLDQLPQDLKYVVKDMNQGDISNITQFIMDDGRQAYRIVKVINKIDEHYINLDDDYTQIYDALVNVKKEEKITNWVYSNISSTYIKIFLDLDDCNVLDKWMK